MDIILAIAIRLIFWCIRILPVRLVGATGAGLGRVAYFLDNRHRDIALNNLHRIYPNKPEAWISRTAKESFAELGRTVLELPHVFLRSESFLKSRIETEGEELFRQAMQQKHGVVITACHHSNWELGAISISLLGYDSSLIYRPMRQLPLERYLKQCRERFGAKLHSRQEGLRWMPRALKEGRSMGILIDQHMSQGIQIPFLGHLANTTELPAPFVIRNNTPLFGVALKRIGRSFRFRLIFWPIQIDEMTGDKGLDTRHIMERISKSFDQIIHERPELWLWVHRRWLVLDEQEIERKTTHGTS
ncbi:MAG: lauroyl acyltransferase [Mariprofundaceae bacterium]